ncbi:hypothetical protein P152DRAFT_445512 [Eremomyces bilateralis CBS 781.70]|uniref:HTH La-type RNA-binding domain-containing protein n=1 Tax=Eremomyces bilateralis CBS 781.70 TaxID=1392243 RepID=A0A6G1GHQ0_9PEZI|nr:uncharacterized protein P152DRAFT_445512 [Eremomyces bilateralis CBS 781.70]KAF1817421.1 hypothetical protein P152DRAFT_445512 [Eremomyces bilateralis CBS 781.70]
METQELPHIEDHPQGDDVRRQVEYYFSDENLPNDAYLLEKCCGSQNLPVSIKKICSFAMMRKYKPYSAVVAALKKSIYLDVVDDKLIKRKIPVILEEVINAEGKPTYKKPPPNLGFPENPKGPTSNNPLMTKGMLKPTGFEEWYADPPVTPAEYKDDAQCYDSSIPIDARMEAAVQRYSSRRKFHQTTRAIFSAWFRYSGWDAGQRQFQGNDPKELENYDAPEIALMTSTLFPGEDKDDRTKWVVDFEGVAKGFLSTRLPNIIHLSTDNVKTATQVMMNMYNWFLHHNVCPEYSQEILAARSVCGLAYEEYQKLIPLRPQLPGPFNIAMSTLFDGYYGPIYGEGDEMVDIKELRAQAWDGIIMNYHMAKVSVLAGLAAIASEKLFAAIIDKPAGDETEKNNGNGECKDGPSSDAEETWVERAKALIPNVRREVGLQITAIEPPSQEVKELYHQHNAEVRKKMHLKPLGTLRCKLWDLQTFRPRDMPEQKRWNPGEIVVHLEDDLLAHCFVGMKISGVIRMVEEGHWWLDEVLAAFPSFYTLLLNDIQVKKWRQPRWLKSREEQEKAERKDNMAE